jgi:hypothetical protein
MPFQMKRWLRSFVPLNVAGRVLYQRSGEGCRRGEDDRGTRPARCDLVLVRLVYDSRPISWRKAASFGKVTGEPKAPPTLVQAQLHVTHRLTASDVDAVFVLLVRGGFDEPGL